jgi:hypothetical protein
VNSVCVCVCVCVGVCVCVCVGRGDGGFFHLQPLLEEEQDRLIEVLGSL